MQNTFDESLRFLFFAANVIASRSKSIMLSETLNMREFSIVGVLFYSAYVLLQAGITVPQRVCYLFFANWHLKKLTAANSVFHHPCSSNQNYRDVSNIFEKEIQSPFQNCMTHLCSSKIDQMPADFLRHTFATSYGMSGCQSIPRKIGWHLVNF